MTAIRQLARPAEPSSSAQLDGATLSWELLPDARTLAWHITPAIARLVLSFNHGVVQATLETQATAHAAIERSPIGAPTPVTLTTYESGAILDIDAPSIVRATIAFPTSPADAPPQLLYARTPLLTMLGFRGGSYDRPHL